MPCLLAAGVTAVIVLDAIDGWVARKLGSTSSFGAFVDVLADRVSNYAAWLFIAGLAPEWQAMVVVVVARDVLVDVTKAITALLGNRMSEGIYVTTRWRRALVLSRASRATYRACTTVVFIGAVIRATYTSDPLVTTGTTVFLGVVTLLCLSRGLGSLLEVPRTLRQGRVDLPDTLWSAFLVQALLGVAVLVLLAMDISVFSYS